MQALHFISVLKNSQIHVKILTFLTIDTGLLPSMARISITFLAKNIFPTMNRPYPQSLTATSGLSVDFFSS